MGVVVTTFNHARFLDEALKSVVAQTRPADEIVVVDDGSSDDPASVVKRYPGVRFLQQERSGPNTARNAGLHALEADRAIFLDADDLLQPEAIEQGLGCFADFPNAALVYGGHLRVDENLDPLGPPRFREIGGNPFHDLLRGNIIGMNGAVMYDRAMLLGIGGFDATLEKCEDYDAYLRLARQHPVACHPHPVALYRIHSGNRSADPADMLDAALLVLEKNRPGPGDPKAQEAFAAGRRNLQLTYSAAAWNDGRTGWNGRWRVTRISPLASVAAAGWSVARAILPSGARSAAKRLLGYGGPPVGQVNMGDLASRRPVSRHFGYDRGTPIDRYFIERFLERHRNDIRGRVLEVGDASYSRRFGTAIDRQDVLHVEDGNPAATIVGDLNESGVLPEGVFDCLVITHTLQYIADFRAAVSQFRRSLRPGGVILLTVPGVATVDRGEWRDRWLWSFTDLAMRQVFEEEFGAGNVEVFAAGNVYAATCFLQGLALEEIDEDLLSPDDPSYPVVVCVRARRAG